MKRKKNDVPKIRCAIYTRKSTDERLDLELNSLDSQRDAAEAFIASQKSEGWVCLPKRYDREFSNIKLQKPYDSRPPTERIRRQAFGRYC